MKSKLPFVGESIFAIMTAEAKKYNAINLSQGFPDFNCDPALRELVKKFMDEGKNQYAPMPGVPELREAIANKTEKLYNIYVDANKEVTVTAGATQAIYTCMNALIHSGDEVIIFEPAYDSYKPAIVVSGGITVPVQMKAPTFNVDWDEVRNKITIRTKAIIVNSPHNPSGYVFTNDDFLELQEIVVKNNLMLISDEVYEHIVFDYNRHFSALNYPELRKRSVAISSFGKTYHTTGWKMGYVIAPPEMTTEIRKAHQFTVFSVNTPIQYAYAEFLKREELYLNLGKFYEDKRDFFLNEVKKTKYKAIPAKGTHFQILDYSEYSNLSDMDFAFMLAKDHGIAVIPLSPFYSEKNYEKYIRVCFAKTEKILREGASRLKIE